MVDHFAQARRFDALDQFVRAERPFSRRAPDVDALRIEREDLAVNAFQRRAQRVETERVISRDEDGRIGRGISQRIQAWLHAMSHAVDRPTRQEVVPTVGKGQRAGSGCDFYGSCH